MEKYIDVLGYLLAAMVFSVGFLGSRVHATYEATVREVREQSWRLRNALLHGDPVGPMELSDAVAVARRTTDQVARLSRIVNRLLFAAMIVVYIGAVWLLAHGASGPPWAYMITSLVFLGGASVIVIGEFDVRNVGIDQQAAIRGSLVGSASELAAALAAGDLQACKKMLASLAETYPSWALLTELRAYVDLREGLPATGLRRVTQLARTGTHLYLTPVVGVACAVAEEDTAAGLRLLDGLIARNETGRNLMALRAGLALGWAHLETMSQEHGPAELDAAVGARPGSAGLAPIPSPQQAGGVPGPSGPLDLSPAGIPETAGLLHLARAWWDGQHEGDLRVLAKGTMLESAMHLVLPLGAGAGAPDVHKLLELTDGASLETFGLILLAQGRTRDALRVIEHSIRIAPGRYRTHWAMAVVCHRMGWNSAAQASLQRVSTLQPDTWLADLTSRAFQSPGRAAEARRLADLHPGARNAIERVQLALLGIPALPPQDARNIQGRFFGALAATALASARARPELAGVRA
jgi:hypothetical protein